MWKKLLLLVRFLRDAIEVNNLIKQVWNFHRKNFGKVVNHEEDRLGK